MKRMLCAVAAVTLMGAPLAAQQTTQERIVGASGDPTYTVRVVGANGESYNCLPSTETLNGQLVRRCQRLGAQGGQLLDGSLTTGGAIAGAGFVLLALAADNSTTTTTN